MKITPRNINGRYFFLIIVAVLYAVTSIIDVSIAKRALEASLALCLQVLPILLLGFTLIFLSNIFLDTKKIVKYVGKDVGIKGWAASIIGGIMSSGPIYIWYPLLSNLREKGMKNSFIVAFLYSRAIKVPLLPLMIYYFGLSFTLVLTLYIIVFSVINGVIVDKFLNKV
ncbi:MAG: permease [Candidatus Pacebacteria bacterium]|nr:permease [Candidatus Paceibacterota bacterium]